MLGALLIGLAITAVIVGPLVALVARRRGVRALGLATLGTGLLVLETAYLGLVCAVSENASETFVEHCNDGVYWYPLLGTIPMYMAAFAATTKRDIRGLGWGLAAFGLGGFLVAAIIPWSLFIAA